MGPDEVLAITSIVTIVFVGLLCVFHRLHTVYHADTNYLHDEELV